MNNYRKLSITVLIGVGIISVLAVFALRNLRFDYEFEDYFPKSDTEYAYYDNFRKTYGSDNDFALICLENKDGAFQLEFLLKVDSLASRLKELEYVESVVSPTQLSYPIKSPFGMTLAKWIHTQEPDRLTQDSIRIFESGELIGTIFSESGTSLIIGINTTYGLSKVKSDLAVTQINEVLQDFSFDEIRVAGRIFGQRYFVEKMVGELGLFTSISFLIIIVFLALAFRSAWGVIVPLAIVAISVVWLMGFMTGIGKAFDLMSTLLPTIMFVVGMSDAVHFISRYLEELRKKTDKVQAIKTSFVHIGKATLLTSVTTAIGFLTLYTSGIAPVRDFGLFTAVGVMFALIITYLVLPPVLYLLPVPTRVMVNSEELFWDRMMRKVFRVVVSKPKKVLCIGGIVLLISLWGVSRVEVNNYLLEDLSKGDPMRKKFEFFEREYSGARPFDVVIKTKDNSSILTLDRIVVLDSVESIIKEELGIKGFISLNTAVKNLNRAYSGGNMNAYTLPTSQSDWKKVNKDLKKAHRSGKLKMFLNDSLNETRVSAQVKDYGGKVFQEKYLTIQKKVEPLLENSKLEIRFTGMGYLIDRNNETLASSLMWGLVIAFGAVALIMGAIFKSLKMVLLTLVPNVIPLLMIGGVMGLMGIDLKVSTSIIFTIAFGIAVDDTIHYVSKLKMELDKGRTLIYALKRASISTGKAIVLTSLILISGFFALVFSDFSSTYYIGLLVSLTLVFAVI
ncbi:MAG: efflux RND transporter permease subunit, partial [Salibacteraceae bacterium]